MTQPVTLQVSAGFAAAVPTEPQVYPKVTAMAALSGTPQTRDQLSCQQLLVGETLVRARAEAAKVLPEILANTQVLAVFGTDALRGVNDLNDRMLSERHPVEVPELLAAMQDLSRQMRGLGKRYDPNDQKVLEKYKQVKGGIRSWLHIGKTFLEEFLEDISSLQQRFELVIHTLQDKQYQLLRNVAYYDVFYKHNEQEIDKLIYVIGVMEIIRDMLAERASRIVIGNSSMGDRGGEEQARLAELVTMLEYKIIAFKGRLWVAWAMAPQIRNMRSISVGLSARIDQTVEITIPTMESTIVVWLTLSDAQMAEQFNRAVEDTYNNVMQMFAHAAQAIVPAVADALSAPALDPRTVVAWSESLAAQADGIVKAIETGQQKRDALEQAMIEGKGVIDAATQRVNQAQLEHVLAAAQQTPLEISRSVQ